MAHEYKLHNRWRSLGAYIILRLSVDPHPLNILSNRTTLWKTLMYMYSVMASMFTSIIFHFKLALVANSKMAAIWLRKVFLIMYIKQFLAKTNLIIYKDFIWHQKCFRFIVNDSKWYKIQYDHRIIGRWIQNTINLPCCVKVILECFIYCEG